VRTIGTHEEDGAVSDPDMGGPGVSRTSHSYEYPAGHHDRAPAGSWAYGVALVAGFLLAVVAAFEILQGIAAIAKDDVYANGPDYAYKLSLEGWGWTHVVIGLLLTAVALGILAQQSWGRVTGLVVAGLSMLANFAFIPYYPVWSLTIIAVNVLVIWALCTLLREEDADAVAAYPPD
jgi:hypothetical protein